MLQGFVSQYIHPGLQRIMVFYSPFSGNFASNNISKNIACSKTTAEIMSLTER